MLGFVAVVVTCTAEHALGAAELLAGPLVGHTTSTSARIWDDHDFGPGDSDRTFQWKDLGLTIFRRYWPNPAPGIPQAPGVFHSFRVADVEFFMLDDRYNRDPRRAKDRSTMLGSIELQWLKERLRTSTATFKVIANGGTIVVDEGKETWDLYGPERDGFLEWMFAEGINGVLFIAGDWQPRSGAVIVFRLTLHVSNSSSE